MLDLIAQAENLPDLVGAHPGLFIAVLGAIATAEFVLVIGFVIPSAITLLIAGTLIAQERVSVWPVFAVVIGGAILGETISYAVGRLLRGGLSRTRVLSAHASRLAEAEALFVKFGPATVCVGRFIPWVDCVVPAMAGSLRMRLGYFALLNVLSAVGWAAVHLLPGILLGRWLEQAGLSPVLVVLAASAALLAVYGAGHLLWRMWRKART